MEVEVSLPAGASARPRLRVTARRDGAHVEVTRELAKGERPKFPFRGLEATLAEWREEYHALARTGEVERIDRAFAIGTDLGGEGFQVRQEVTLEPQSRAVSALRDALRQRPRRKR